MTCLSSTTGLSCPFTLTLFPSGQGIEVDSANGCAMYSIGNQTIDASMNDSGNCCGNGTITVNGNPVPASVCDGDLLTIAITCPNGTATLEGVNCAMGLLFAPNYMRPTKRGFAINVQALFQEIKNRRR